MSWWCGGGDGGDAGDPGDGDGDAVALVVRIGWDCKTDVYALQARHIRYRGTDTDGFLHNTDGRGREISFIHRVETIPW